MLSSTLPENWISNPTFIGNPNAYGMIMSFFCVASPMPRKSLRGTPLQDLPWYQQAVGLTPEDKATSKTLKSKKKYLTEKLLAHMMRKGKKDEIFLEVIDKDALSLLPQLLKKGHLTNDEFLSPSHTKESIVLTQMGQNRFESILGHLHAAFSHGHFSIEENFTGEFVYKIHYGKKLNQYELFQSRMVIKENTLLEWISFIATGKNLLPSYQQVTIFDLLSS